MTRPEAAFRATVIWAGVTSSLPLEAVVVKAADGWLSLSWMVYVCTVVPPRVAPSGLLRVTWKVSSTSLRASLITVDRMFFVVCPAVKDRVPEGRV